MKKNKASIIKNENSIKSSELWVVQTSYASDIYHIFIKKEDADKELKRYSKECYVYYRKRNKRMTDAEFENHFGAVMKNMKVITLEDAIENVTDAAVDNSTIQGEEY